MRRAFFVIVIVGLAAGCASSPPARFYTLGAIPGPPAGAPADVSVAVGPVSVPLAVDRPQIVIARNTHQVSLDEFNRWSSPLASNLARVVAQNLATELSTPRVGLSAEAVGDGRVDYRAAIEVQRFESALGEAATLEAVWTVSRALNGRSQTGRTLARETPSDKSYDALVSAHSRAVGRLRRDIAAAVRALHQ